MPRWIKALIVVSLLLAVIGALAWSQRDWVMAQLFLRTLESPNRVRELQLERVIEALAIEPGDKLVDLGAGTGLFTWPLAEATGSEGVVYAVDVNDRLLEHLTNEARARAQDNVEVIRAAPADPELPETVDLVFICNTLHHLPDPPTYLKTLRRYLGPSGRVAVIDFDEGGAHFLSGYDAEDLARWFEDAGYEHAGSFDFVGGNFFEIYQCRECPDGSGSGSSAER